MSASRYLIINPSGVVENVIIYDPAYEFLLPQGYELIPYTCHADIGFTRNEDGSFTPPPAEE